MDPRPYHYQYRKPRLSNPTFQSGHLYESIYHVGSFTRMNPNVDKINNNYVMPSNNQLRSQYNTVNQNNQQKGRSSRDAYFDQAKHNGPDRYTNNNQNNNGNQGNKINYRYDLQQNGNLNNYQSSRIQNQSNLGRKSISYVRQQPQQYKQPQLPRQSSQQKTTIQARQYQNNSSYPNQNQGYQLPNQKRQAPSQPRSYSQDTRSSSQKQQFDQGYMSNYGSRLMRPMPGRDQDFIYQRQQKPYNIISCYPKDGPANTHRVYPRFTLESKLIQNGQYPFPESNTHNNQNPQRF